MGSTNLATYRAENPHKGFSKQPHYYPVGDYLTFYASDERCFAERVNELLTVYVSTDDRHLVGCKVKNVQQVMQQLEQLHVHVFDSQLSLGLLFVSVAAITEETDTRGRVLDYAKHLPETTIPKHALRPAA